MTAIPEIQFPKRTFALSGQATSERLTLFALRLSQSLIQAGLADAEEPSSPDFLLNLIDAENPKPFRRSSKGTFVAALHERNFMPDDIEEARKLEYPLLVRALANIVLCYVPSDRVWFTTMERGHYSVDGKDEKGLAEAVVERLLPLATSKLVIDNEFRTDLEPELWKGDEHTAEIIEAGQWLENLGLLPAPFPLEDFLSERELRHVKRLYGIGGLSYGNLSQRLDKNRFWMSASGVDKSKLEVVGRDILLVSGYDEVNGRMIISVPPGVEPRRVSVDAIEHWMIYQAHPEVNAILHVHAWMEGIQATEINFPCGTEELATSVAKLVDREPNPAEAVIGLYNHGITATGPGLAAVIGRIKPKIIRQIPMT